MSVLDAVSAAAERHGLLKAGPAVVGVSGGVDSMVLAHALHRLGANLAVVHVNYGMREGADADAALVEDWCAAQEPAVPCRVVARDPEARAAAHGESLQEAARHQRYAAFAEAAEAVGAAVVAVAHQRDDQAETLLLNLMRGSGPEGLAGMREARPLAADADRRLVRPLLRVRRADVEAYADREGVPWHHDPTNDSDRYRRSALRQSVLPALESLAPGATEAIARSADLLRDYVDDALEPALQRHFEACHVRRDAGGWLDAEALRERPPVWRRRVLLEALSADLPDAPASKAVAEEVKALLDAQVGRRVELGGGTVWRERGGLRLVPASAAASRLAPTPLPLGEPVQVPGGTLRAERLAEVPEVPPDASPRVAHLDADRLDGPLTVRSWREGDRLRPLGMDGTKTVSDLLTDARIPPSRRRTACVVLHDERIAWVVGHRLAHAVRLRPGTRQAVRLVSSSKCEMRSARSSPEDARGEERRGHGA
jgi:tRNA(Ile)-lysidine synthase